MLAPRLGLGAARTEAVEHRLVVRADQREVPAPRAGALGRHQMYLLPRAVAGPLQPDCTANYPGRWLHPAEIKRRIELDAAFEQVIGDFERYVMNHGLSGARTPFPSSAVLGWTSSGSRNPQIPENES